MGSTVLMLALMGAAFYFLLIRPQQKRAKKQTEMTNSLIPGARVMLSSGVYGTIRHLGERQAIIEIAPGIEMTVVKQAIVKTLAPEDDEFEYADDAAEPAEAATGSPFDTIQPSDFADPSSSGYSDSRPSVYDDAGPSGFEDARPSDFDDVKPSDFDDVKPSDFDDPRTSDVHGSDDDSTDQPNTQK